MSTETNGHNGLSVHRGHSQTRAGAASARLSQAAPTRPFSALRAPLLAGVINHLHRNLKEGKEAMQRMESNEMFRLFTEEQYQRTKPELAQSFRDTVCDRSVPHVSSFILSVLHQGRFSVTECIISMFYLSRFKQSSGIKLHAAVWRPLFLTALLISDKVWQDTPVRNSALTKLFPVLSNADLKKLEYEFVTTIQFDVNVTPESFRNFCESLLAEKVEPEIHDRVYASDFYRTTLMGPESSVVDEPEPLHEDDLWAHSQDGFLPQNHGQAAPQPQLAQSPRAALGAVRGQGSQARDLRVDVQHSSRSSNQAFSPHRTTYTMPGPRGSARDSGARQSHSLGSLPGNTTGPSASTRMSAAMRAVPLTPQGPSSQRRGPSPGTPDGVRRPMPVRPASAEKVSLTSAGSVPRPMGLTVAPTSGSASAGAMHRPVSAGGMVAVPPLLSRYTAMGSAHSMSREANSPMAPDRATLRQMNSPNREANTPKGPMSTNRTALSPSRDTSPRALTRELALSSSVTSAAGGGSLGSSVGSTAAMMSCSPSAASSAKGSFGNGPSRDPHAMSFKQKQQLFAKAEPAPKPRHTLRGQPRADSVPERSPGMGLKQGKPINSARVVAPGSNSARATAPKFSGQEQQLSASRSQSTTAAPTSPAHGVYGLAAMSPNQRAALQGQRSRATVPAVRPSPQQVAASTPAPGQAGSPAQGNAARSPNSLFNTARGRSSSPAYVGAHAMSLETHPGMTATARSTARVVAPGDQGR